MRLLTTGIAALAACTFTLAPASACSWGKTASAKQMTVAETTVAPDAETDVSIATNDLSDEAVKNLTAPQDALETPAD
jgi:hypothetical protein